MAAMKNANPNMNVPIFQMPDRVDESFRVIEVGEGYSGCSWHFHRELQLCHVTSGIGKRVVGDRVCDITEGEVVLLGQNLPHVWRYDPTQSEQPKAVVVHFKEDFLGAEFSKKPEMRDVMLLLARAGQGLLATGQTRNVVAEKLCALPKLTGMGKLLGLLEILHCLAESTELETICSTGFQPVAAQLDIERLRRVCEYVDQHHKQQIDRDSVARLVHMSGSGFSRFFKSRTGMTFQDYVGDLRVGRACQLLTEAGRSITEIAFECGFSEMSTFNRAFKKFRNVTPSEYREEMLRLRK